MLQLDKNGTQDINNVLTVFLKKERTVLQNIAYI